MVSACMHVCRIDKKLCTVAVLSLYEFRCAQFITISSTCRYACEWSSKSLCLLMQSSHCPYQQCRYIVTLLTHLWLGQNINSYSLLFTDVKLLCPYHHVHLLHAVCIWTKCAEVSLVEEIRHCASDGKKDECQCQKSGKRRVK